MLESLEGRRGEVRAKPPIPALEGLFGQPTVVNNVLTLATVPMVLADGGAAYAALGTDRSRGTQVFQLGDMSAQARFAMEFCAKESCGKCTPCRIGSTRGVEVIDAIRAGVERDANLVLLEDLCETMTKGSLCAMGGLTPMPVRSAITHFPEDFGIDIPVQTGGPR